jgi:hypothetical protein
MTNTISNQDNVIDSRDVIEWIEELEGERDTLQEAYDEAEDESEEQRIAQNELDAWNTSEEGEELTALKTLAEQGENYCSDWKHGDALIKDSYFNEYMDDLLEDSGDIPKDLPCYLTITVDYDALKQDYMSVDFDGETYWVR